VAEYYGLPEELVFLRNEAGEILLDMQPVLEEFWPMMTSKVRGDVP
jgi:hypothetical protein